MNTYEAVSFGSGETESRAAQMVVRFAGDSGDGMQLAGGQFTLSTALAGNDLATFPDFPAEVRAPQGTTFGVSSFQIHFGSNYIKTAGDQIDVLIAMNPAAFKVNLSDLRPGGLIIADVDEFTSRNLKKAGYETNPLEADHLGYQLLKINITQMTIEAVKPWNLSRKEAVRCKNLWTLGLVLWMFGRKRAPVHEWLKQKFANRENIACANKAALDSGHAYGETAEIGLSRVYVDAVKAEPGLYRTIAGGEALSFGLVAGAKLAGLKLFFGSYPITPASPILHSLSNLTQFGVTTYQAEDEIAAICSAIGASYGGHLGITSSSGPGIALKTEAIGLAIMAELPLVIIDSQRGGPSTGLPTKTEQSDLYLALYGRNGDAPIIVLAARSPADCFETAVEACRLAATFMTPVMLLTDGYIANAAEPWKIPNMDDYDPFEVIFHTTPVEEGVKVNPTIRDPEKLARIWIRPGTPGLANRIGGIEKDIATGNICYDAENHQKMTNLRRDKILGVSNYIPEQSVTLGDRTGKVAVVGWGSTYGSIIHAVRKLRDRGESVSHIHLRHIWPLPRNLGDLLSGFETILVPEMNTGQLKTLLRDQYLVDAKTVNQVNGQPFKIDKIVEAIEAFL